MLEKIELKNTEISLSLRIHGILLWLLLLLLLLHN
jgi:hypothetical protein